MTNQYIQYTEYLKLKAHRQELESQGVVFIFKKNKFKLVCGISCLVIAVIPNGLGIVFYPLGFYLLGIGSADLFKYKELFIKKLKFRNIIRRG